MTYKYKWSSRITPLSCFLDYEKNLCITSCIFTADNAPLLSLHLRAQTFSEKCHLPHL